ncbi:MAG: DUF3309 domain-containing protein [Terriglobales bacterium]
MNSTSNGAVREERAGGKMLRILLIVILLLLLIGSLPTWGYSTGWGYYPSGGLGLVLVIVVILALMNRGARTL